MMPAWRRPIKAVRAKVPRRRATRFWLDTFGIDSEYDYDPLWTKCRELKIAPTFHSGRVGLGFTRSSISNFMHNHVGHFAVGRRIDLQGAILRRRDPTLPRIDVFIPRRRRRLGLRLCSPTSPAIGRSTTRAVAQLYDPARLDRSCWKIVQRVCRAGVRGRMPDPTESLQLLWGREEREARGHRRMGAMRHRA